VNGLTTQYVYDGRDIVQEIQGGTTTNYIRTPNIDEPLARIKADGTIRHYKSDALGSVIALTDDTGVIRTTYTYDPFGNVPVSGETSDNPFQYTGRENDGTGLYYYRARYYSPELQRFVSEDPIKIEGGINFYEFVGNNPVNFVDPTGNAALSAALREAIIKCAKGAVIGAGLEATFELGKCCYDQCCTQIWKCDFSKCKINLCNVAVSSLASCVASAVSPNLPVFPVTWPVWKEFLKKVGLNQVIKQFGKYGCK
jgi:RHS repeat-associated protein